MAAIATAAPATATRDQRGSRTGGRRGGARRNHSSAESLAVKGVEGSDAEPQQLSVAALLGTDEDQICTASSSISENKEKDMPKDGAAAGGGSKAMTAATRSMLQRLPTPSRGGLAPSPSQAIESAAKGPEPWSLPAASASPPSGVAAAAGTAAAAADKNGGYREWLQSRGQQAMQRSRKPGCAGAPSPPTAPPATAAPTGLLEALQIPAPPQAVPWNVPGTSEAQMQQWFAANGVDMSQMMNGQQSPMGFNGFQQGPQTPVSAGQQSPMSFFGCQQGSTTPGSEQQTPMSFFSCQAGPTTPVSGQPSPMGFQQSVGDAHGHVSFFGCQQAPATPLGGGQQPAFFGSTAAVAEQQTPVAFCPPGGSVAAAAAASGQQSQSEITYAGSQPQAPSGQQELMATLAAMMPGAFALGRDNDAIAEQLQNAANCCYED